MTTTNTKRVVIGIPAATFLLLVSNGAPAQAYAQDSWTNAQVSCSHGTYQYVDSSLQHLIFGDV